MLRLHPTLTSDLPHLQNPAEGVHDKILAGKVRGAT